MNCTAPISASSWRMIRPKPFDSAAERRAEQRRDDEQRRDAADAARERRADDQRQRDDDQRLDHDHDRFLEDAAGDQRLAPHRRDEEAGGDAAVDVFDQRHPAPGRVEHRRHHHHAGGEERDVGVPVEARDLDDLLEQRAEQQQPDHRLHQRDADEPRLAPQLAQMADRHVQGLPDQRHRFTSAAVPRPRPRRTCGRCSCR